MALHGWGQLMSIAHIAAELGISPNGLGLGDVRVRALLGDQGAVYMSNAYGKSNNYNATMGVGNSGVDSGVYRPNASSGWVYGSFSDPNCFGVPILSFTWSVDRYDNASAGDFVLNSSIGATLRMVINGSTYQISNAGGGRYPVPAAACQLLENSNGVSIQIYKA